MTLTFSGDLEFQEFKKPSTSHRTVQKKAGNPSRETAKKTGAKKRLLFVPSALAHVRPALPREIRFSLGLNVNIRNG